MKGNEYKNQLKIHALTVSIFSLPLILVLIPFHQYDRRTALFSALLILSLTSMWI